MIDADPMLIDELIPPGHPAQGVLAYLAEFGVRLNGHMEVVGCHRVVINLGHLHFAAGHFDSSRWPTSISLGDRFTVINLDDHHHPMVKRLVFHYHDPELFDKLRAVVDQLRLRMVSQSYSNSTRVPHDQR